MEDALKTLAGQGVIGAMMVLLLLAVVYLQKKRDGDSEARLKDTRESLHEAAETTRIVGGFRDTVAGLTQGMTSLTVTVQNMHSDIRGAREANQTRDNRVEAMIERNGSLIKDIESVVKENNRLIERSNVALDNFMKAGR